MYRVYRVQEGLKSSFPGLRAPGTFGARGCSGRMVATFRLSELCGALL